MKTPPSRLLVGDRVAIYARGKRGLYQADFHYRGQHRRRSLKTTNKKIAVQRAMKLAVEIQERTVDHDERVPAAVTRTSKTLEAAREAYVNYKKSSGNQPKSYGKDNGTLKNFNAFAADKGVVRVDQVTLTLIDGFREHRSQQLVRGKTIGPTQKYHDLALLKRFFEWCAARQMMPANPMDSEKVTRPPQRRREKCTPTIDQVNTILGALPPRMYGPVAVLTFTGMRSANCRQLLTTDVDLAGSWVHVRSRGGARTKCGNEWKVPIHPRLEQVLRGLQMPKKGYVFTAPPSRKYPEGGHWINMKHLNDEFVAILKKIGMPAGREAGFTIHSLRHFFKSFCLPYVPPAYIDAWQGHTSPKSVSDLYAHTFDAESQRLIRLVPFGDGAPAANAG
jgi:integrase